MQLITNTIKVLYCHIPDSIAESVRNIRIPIMMRIVPWSAIGLLTTDSQFAFIETGFLAVELEQTVVQGFINESVRN